MLRSLLAGSNAETINTSCRTSGGTVITSRFTKTHEKVSRRRIYAGALVTYQQREVANGQPFEWGIGNDFYGTADLFFDKRQLFLADSANKLLLNILIETIIFFLCSYFSERMLRANADNAGNTRLTPGDIAKPLSSSVLP